MLWIRDYGYKNVPIYLGMGTRDIWTKFMDCVPPDDKAVTRILNPRINPQSGQGANHV